MFSLAEMLSRESGQIKIIDVGAMSLGPEEIEYRSLLKPDVSKVIGFEPVEEECHKLNQLRGGEHLFLPYCIGDGSERNFNLCNYPMTSSLYEPNMVLLEKFQDLAELSRVVERNKVRTKRLDDIDEVRGADYLKIDVQGAEVDVFRGAVEILADVMVIHTEVEFVPMYIDQPLFAEVDQALREQGFLFHKFYGIAGRTFKPIIVNGNISQSLSQQLWADAIYVKNFLYYDRLPPQKLLKLAVIMHEVYGSYDIAHHALQYYDKHTNSQWAVRYLQLLMQRTKTG